MITPSFALEHPVAGDWWGEDPAHFIFKEPRGGLFRGDTGVSIRWVYSQFLSQKFQSLGWEDGVRRGGYWEFHGGEKSVLDDPSDLFTKVECDPSVLRQWVLKRQLVDPFDPEELAEYAAHLRKNGMSIEDDAHDIFMEVCSETGWSIVHAVGEGDVPPNYGIVNWDWVSGYNGSRYTCFYKRGEPTPASVINQYLTQLPSECRIEITALGGDLVIYEAFVPFKDEFSPKREEIEDYLISEGFSPAAVAAIMEQVPEEPEFE
jgi:hypothetical protein